jgi:manganese/iron transport system substrate-binding protein
MSLIQKNKNIRLIGCLIFICISISGCISSSKNEQKTQENKPNVVATSTIIEDLTDDIAGDEIKLIGILKPGTDPHVYEPVPADSVALEKAQLILYNGYNLEPGLIKLMKTSGGKAKQVPVGEIIQPLELAKKVEKVPDPHVWGDVKNVIKMSNAIRDELIKLSPEDKEKFTRNAAKLTAELESLDLWVSEQIATIPPNQRLLVTTHDAFQYYAKAYNLEIIGTLIGISTEEQPSAQTVKNLVNSIKAKRVQALFAETTINPTLITTVAQESGVKLSPKQLYSDSIGAPGSEGDSYIKMVVANTRTIVDALGGKSQPFNP